jgi:predicted AlkP superfamily phosphohydrolase/phosphomutase/Tfp pilus assembly protein PilF
MAEPLAKKVLLIGWDAADWKVATPLLEQGRMPALDDFINHGVMGNLATLQPVLSPMLWNSIATGKRADKHGIHGFAEPDPNSGGVRPVTSTSRKVKAIWNILTQKGYKTHLLGWFAGHPAEPINGISVSDLYPLATAPHDKPWPLPPGAVHPESVRDQLAELRLHPAELDAGAILPFVPQAAKVDQEKDKSLSVIAKLLAENSCIHNVATWILQTEPWDFMGVYYNGIDHFCHAFMHYHPPRLEGVPEDKFEIYKEVVNGAYRFHDMMLQTLLELAGPDATVIICSDHGFHPDHLRPRGIPDEPAGPAVQHRRFGMVCMKGAGIKQDERIYGATLLDVTPTILTLFGLPVGEDMDGRVLVQAFEEPPKIERIPSWEQEPGECGMHPSDMHIDADSAQAVLNQFAALGYIAPTDDQKKAVESALREAKYNLARVYMDKGQPRLALPLFEELYKEQPEQARFAQQLAQCYFGLRRIEDAKRVLTELMNRTPKDREQTEANAPGEIQRRETEEQRQETRDERQEAEEQNQGPTADPGLETSDGQRTSDDVQIGNRQSTIVNPRRPWADWLMGVIHFEEGNMAQALESLLRAEQFEPRMPDLPLRIGQTYLRLKRLDDAERAFRKALEIDGDSPEAHLGLASVLLRKRQNEGAVEEALIAVSLQHFLPMGHFYLGVGLARLGHFHRATLAFETALIMVPGFINAHRWLSGIHSQPGGDPAKANEHRRLIAALTERRRAAVQQ